MTFTGSEYMCLEGVNGCRSGAISVYAQTVDASTRARSQSSPREPLERGGLEVRRFQDLRHSTGTFLASRGVHPRPIMEILGHSQIGTTMYTYTHVEPASMRDALDSLGDLFPADKWSS